MAPTNREACVQDAGQGARCESRDMTGKLRLLVAFHAPVQTRKRLHFGDRAQAVVSANFNRVFGTELAKAHKACAVMHRPQRLGDAPAAWRPHKHDISTECAQTP